jgi:hypothetical protein
MLCIAKPLQRICMARMINQGSEQRSRRRPLTPAEMPTHRLQAGRPHTLQLAEALSRPGRAVLAAHCTCRQETMW